MRKKLGSPELKLFDWVYVPGAGISYTPGPNQFLPKTLSICDLGGCLGNLFLLALIDIYINLIGFLKPSPFLFSIEESDCLVLSDLVLAKPRRL